MSSWLSWLIASLFFSYQYVLRVMPSTLLDELLVRYNIGPSMFGQISGMYYVAYTLAHIPIGIMLDRIGPRKVIAGCAFISVLGSLPLVFSDSWVVLILGRISLAVVSSAGVIGVFKVLSIHFPVERFAMLFGISVTSAYMGAVLAGQPMRHLVNLIGLEWSMGLLMVVGLAISVSALFFIVDESKVLKSNKKSILQDLKVIFINKQWLYISLLGGLMIGPLEGFADGWSIKFIAVHYSNISSELAALFSSLIFIGFAFSAPILGYIAQRIDLKHYNIFVMLLGFVLLISFCSVLLLKVPLWLLALMLVIIGMTSNYQSLIIIKSSTMVPEENNSLVSACSNMVMMIFGYFFHTVISMVLSVSDTLYSDSAFLKAFSVIPIAILAALIGFIILIFKKSYK